MKSIDEYYEETVEFMKSLGIYKPEFYQTIKIYAQKLYQYDILFERYIKGGMKSQTKSSGGMKSSPLVRLLENLTKEIVSLSDRLGLTPKALESLKPKEKESPDSELIKALKISMVGDDGSTQDFI